MFEVGDIVRVKESDSDAPFPVGTFAVVRFVYTNGQLIEVECQGQKHTFWDTFLEHANPQRYPMR